MSGELKHIGIFEKSKDGKTGKVLDCGDAARMIEVWGLHESHTYAAIRALDKGAKRRIVNGYEIKTNIDVRPEAERSIDFMCGRKDKGVIYLSKKKYAEFEVNRQAVHKAYEDKKNAEELPSFDDRVWHYEEQFKKKYFHSEAQSILDKLLSEGFTHEEIECRPDFIAALENGAEWDVDDMMLEAGNDYLYNSNMRNFNAKAKLCAAMSIRDCRKPKHLPARRNFDHIVMESPIKHIKWTKFIKWLLCSKNKDGITVLQDDSDDELILVSDCCDYPEGLNKAAENALKNARSRVIEQ